MVFFNRYFRYFDWINFGITLVLSCLGILLIFSATYSTQQPYSLFFKKQCLGIIGGLFIYTFCCFIDYRTLMHWGYIGYIFILALLIATLIKGKIVMGGQRWISLFFFKIQPSELAKLLFPAFAAFQLSLLPQKQVVFFNFLPLLGILTISFFLVRSQPDLGTALVILFSGFIMFWFAGLHKNFFFILFLLLLVAAPLLWQYALKPYQQDRIAVFFGKGNNKKERYQTEQAIIAIGSGGFLGKGFMQGTQNKLRFLPESRTDFIFAVLCEEMGFIGAFFVILLYLILFMRLLSMTFRIKHIFVQLLALGICIHIILAAIINIGMVTNLLPIVGIPLPLLSYGLCNLWITLASLGFLQSISMQRGAFGE